MSIRAQLARWEWRNSDMWIIPHHLIYGLLTGIPICCIFHFIRCTWGPPKKNRPFCKNVFVDSRASYHRCNIVIDV